jgi:predicted RNase H-like nuclease
MAEAGPSKPIAVDPSYRIRDNQFWYRDCQFADRILGLASIVLRISGLGVRRLTHASVGSDGRQTYSYRLPTREDREWWENHRGERVRVELLGVSCGTHETLPRPAGGLPKTSPGDTPVDQSDRSATKAIPRVDGRDGSVLCIGLDIAWFGGSKSDPSSQFDCIGSVVVADGSARGTVRLTRVALNNRDPDAVITLREIDRLIADHSDAARVLLALDAPIQEASLPIPMGRTKRRRACEELLSERRQLIDRVAGGAAGWHPNIQPGAPLAPRVTKLLQGLADLGFDLWTPENRNANRLVIECFPAEAIWAMKRMGQFPAAMTSGEAKAYKSQKRRRLTGMQVQELVHTVLPAFGFACGATWPGIVDSAIAWMLADPSWQVDGFYRGGKQLDDVVDTMICVATSLGYATGCAHVWYDPEHPDDGHIVGPGYESHGRWISPFDKTELTRNGTVARKIRDAEIEG